MNLLANQSTIDITWLDPENDPVPSERITNVRNASTLTFNPLAASDAGTYTCSIRAGNTTQNARIFITVESKLRNMFYSVVSMAIDLLLIYCA